MAPSTDGVAIVAPSTAERGPDRDAPIGVFDSGVGGLSVLRAIHDALPAERLVYIADSAHAPYGDRDPAFVRDRSAVLVELLLTMGVKAIVVACNTASVLAVDALRARHAIPIVAMEPAIKPAVARTHGVVGVLATRQTLASASVARLCAAHAGSARIVLQACPGWVEQVERGDLDGPVTRELVTRHLSPLMRQGVDVLVLGCTHYPFLRPTIRAVVGPGVVLIDAAEAVAAQVARRVSPRAATSGSVRYLSSGEVKRVGAVMSALWGHEVVVEPITASGSVVSAKAGVQVARPTPGDGLGPRPAPG